MAKEGRFEDIYRKFGKKYYNQYFTKAKYNEIKYSKGNLKAILWKIKNI